MFSETSILRFQNTKENVAGKAHSVPKAHIPGLLFIAAHQKLFAVHKPLFVFSYSSADLI